MNKKEIFIKRELNNRANDGFIDSFNIEIDSFSIMVFIEVNGKNYELHPNEIESLYIQGLEDFKNELNDDFGLRGDDVEIILNKIFG